MGMEGRKEKGGRINKVGWEERWGLELTGEVIEYDQIYWVTFFKE